MVSCWHRRHPASPPQSGVDRIWLTASGGPFRTTPLEISEGSIIYRVDFEGTRALLGFLLGIQLFTFVPQIFFPTETSNFFVAEFTFPPGTSIRTTEAMIEDMDEFVERGARAVIDEAREIIGDAPVYVTFDVDGLDPAFAPGTGTPEVGGFSTAEAIMMLQAFRGANVIGGDVVEVAPETLWRVGDDEEPMWRASLKSAHTGQQVGFGNLEELFEFLRWRTDQSSSEQIAAQGTGSAAPQRNPSPNPA